MKNFIQLLLFIFILIKSTAFAATVMNNNISVREGAGAFYPVTTVLNKGDEVNIIKDNDSWKKVKTNSGVTGWVSSNAFKAVASSIDYGIIAQDLSKRTISKSMVTAAVKGFFENQINNPLLNRKILEQPHQQYNSPESYLRFKNETFEGRWKQKKFKRKNKIKQKGNFYIDEGMVAVSAYIVAKLTAPGIIEDQRVLIYVNNVAQLIVESTEFFDLPVTVHIADSNEIFANATPIGVIVISKGMIKMIKSEHELACLIGHELSHVTLAHGSTEIEIRKPLFAAEDGFSEIDQELGTDADTQELESMANEMYERSIKGRKDKYEMEADTRGIIYARRAGYNISGMVSLLKRIQASLPRSLDPDDSQHWIPYHMNTRIQSLEKYMGGKFKHGKQYQKFQRRYSKFCIH